MSIEYGYTISDDILEGFSYSIQQTIQSLVDNIGTYDIEILSDEKGSYIIGCLVEVEEYCDTIDTKSFIDILTENAKMEMGESAENYLEDVDLQNLKVELSFFWEKYKRDKKITPMLVEKPKTEKVYKIYVKERTSDFELINYEEIC